ncbi:amino acid permease [Streptomyces lavendulae subsp. lavendulae]|uniref:APC family permease n=1 Tax=Streptomyces TaxID=1883 RepID=UPI0006AD95BA|nr:MULTISPECIES: APC family permease [unclassified Streptomyces]KOU12108.1 amino acid permease [Streptomyces sp. WM6349]KOU80430.1 amino acid permease [Streptomyces sp. XY593]KOV39395.1 amino acid permease [Streptomyces sp. H036]GLV95405.1 amino acid permease [Streptomyces lavendulae subsp. lavendulae]
MSNGSTGTPRSTRAARPAGEVQRLKANSVGLVGVVFMAVATAAPITAMTGNLPIAVGFGNGTGAPAGYLFATAVLTVFAVGYVAMAKRITAAGAFYGYISHGLGRIAGMASGMLAVLAYVVFEASIVGVFSYFAQTTVEDQLGIDLPWVLYAAAMLAVTAGLAHFDINLTAKALGVMLVAEIAVLFAVATAVLVAGGGPDGIPLEPVDPRNAFTGTSAGLGLFFAFWSWVGFESTAMYGEESRDPKRVIPRATLISVVGVGLFYIYVSWMTIAGNGLTGSVELSSSANPLDLFFAPTRQFMGAWAVDAFQWLLLTGSFACGMAFHQCAARYLYAIGREGFLHPALGRTHARHGSPHVASVVQTAIAVALVAGFWLTGQDPYLHLYTLLAILGTMAILIVQTLCSFAVIGYFRRNHPEDRHWFRTLTAPLLGGIGMTAVVVLLVVNMETAAGAAAGSVFFKLIPWIVGAVFFGGLGLGLWLKAKAPERYEVIGRIVLEDAAERTDDGTGPGADGTTGLSTSPANA